MKNSIPYGYSASQLDCNYQSDKPFVINNCGMLRTPENSEIPQKSRLRIDYMFIYLFEGNGVARIDGKDIKVAKGELIFFKPNMPLSFALTKNSQHYWIHFSGTATDEMLKMVGITNSGVYKTEYNQKICNSFFEIISWLSLGNEDSNMLLALSEFYKILSLFSQKIKDHKVDSIFDSKIQDALRYMHLHYDENHPLDFYADLCNMSLSTFKHEFSKIVKITPRNYITSLKIDNAKRLLSETTFSIKEISQAVGYEDPLYFSRIFKKFIGESPKQYVLKQNKKW